MNTPYTTDNYPHYVCASGRNFGIWASGSGHLASIPTAIGRRRGCIATHFGDWRYLASLGRRY